MGKYNDRKAIGEMYDRKVLGEENPLNALLAHQDGLLLFHSGRGEEGVVPMIDDENERLRVLHQMEKSVVATAANLLHDLGPGAVVLNAGCGAGADSIQLASIFNARVEGVTLGAEEVRYARAAAARYPDPLAERVRFEEGDMAGYCEGKRFDAIWACESTPHVDDLVRVFRAWEQALRPGGRVVVVTWCAGEGADASAVKAAVDRHYLTNIHSRGDYLDAARTAGLRIRQALDVTASTRAYWQLRARSAHRTGSEEFMTGAIDRGAITYQQFVFDVRLRPPGEPSQVG